MTSLIVLEWCCCVKPQKFSKFWLKVKSNTWVTYLLFLVQHWSRWAIQQVWTTRSHIMNAATAVTSVAMKLIFWATSMHTPRFTLVNGHFSAMFAPEASQRSSHWRPTWASTQGSGRISATFAPRISHKDPIWRSTCAFTLASGRTNVTFAPRASCNCPHWRCTSASTQARDHFSAHHVWRHSVRRATLSHTWINIGDFFNGRYAFGAFLQSDCLFWWTVVLLRLLGEH